MPRKSREAPERQPWLPSDYTEAQMHAIKALARGDANEHQQRTALKYIVETLAGVYDMEFRPGPEGDRDSAFAGGKRWVGLQIVKLANMPPRNPNSEQS